MLYSKAVENGQSECKRCKEKGKYSLTWASFLYKIYNEEGFYCFDCIKEIEKERQVDYKQRIDKAIKCYLKELAILNADNQPMDKVAVKMFNILEGNINEG